MKIKIATDFSKTPGGRFIKEGPCSGEEFREALLIPMYDAAVKRGKKLTIDFDGGYGYPPGFLEEAFGGMVREKRELGILNHIELISEEEPDVIERVMQYVSEAEDNL